MANVRNANTFYIDTAAASSAAGDASNLAAKNIKVSHILVTPTAANGRLVLSDVTTGAVKIDVRTATSGQSEEFENTKNPWLFPNGIYVQTLINAVATVTVEESRG